MKDAGGALDAGGGAPVTVTVAVPHSHGSESSVSSLGELAEPPEGLGEVPVPVG